MVYDDDDDVNDDGKNNDIVRDIPEDVRISISVKQLPPRPSLDYIGLTAAEITRYSFIKTFGFLCSRNVTFI